jgi:hypothetical protein
VSESVVGAIAPNLEKAEIERARRKPTASLDAYDYYLRGMACFYQWTREAHEEALLLFHRAIALDPDFTVAHAVAARCYAWRKTHGWMTDVAAETAECTRLARRRPRWAARTQLPCRWRAFRWPAWLAISTRQPP